MERKSTSKITKKGQKVRSVRTYEKSCHRIFHLTEVRVEPMRFIILEVIVSRHTNFWAGE